MSKNEQLPKNATENSLLSTPSSRQKERRASAASWNLHRAYGGLPFRFKMSLPTFSILL
jgi:hypothetical protein